MLCKTANTTENYSHSCHSSLEGHGNSLWHAHHHLHMISCHTEVTEQARPKPRHLHVHLPNQQHKRRQEFSIAQTIMHSRQLQGSAMRQGLCLNKMTPCHNLSQSVL